MSKLAISIEFDRPSRQYYPGEVISGKVVVRPVKYCKSSELFLSIEWYLHSTGRWIEEAIEKVNLFSGELDAGTTRYFQFSFVAPDRPNTYRGHYFNIDWRICAHANNPWASNIKIYEDILILPRTLPTSFLQSDRFTVGVWNDRIMALMGIFALVVSIFSITKGINDRSVFICIVFSVPGIAGFYMLFKARGLLVRVLMRIVDVEIELSTKKDSNKIDMNDLYVITYIKSGKAIRLKFVRATLYIREVVEIVGGSIDTMATYVRHMDTVQLAYIEDKKFGGKFTIPKSAPISFNRPSNEIQWTIEVEIEASRWRKWKKEFFLQVDL